ncbi:MAG: DUF4625 domain-containing protein [Breznakibacter sp.]|nr:DUF4625 domain-containing protein [Breznakibacter sp.]
MKKSVQLIMILALAALFTAVSCKSSSDPAPDPAGPTIVVTFSVDNAEFFTGATLSVDAVLTSGSALSTLTASVTWVSELDLTAMVLGLKSAPSPWNPTPKVVTLNGTSAQTLVAESLFSPIPATAKAGNYKLKLEVKDSAGKSVVEEILFTIPN